MRQPFSAARVEFSGRRWSQRRSSARWSGL